MFSILVLFALNVVTPGASFILTVRNALSHGRAAGLLVALGLSSMDFVYAVAALLGLAAVMTQFPSFALVVSVFGGMWLTKLGLSLYMREDSSYGDSEEDEAVDALTFYKTGATMGATNPQGIVFFSSAFLTSATTGLLSSYAAMLLAGVALVSVVLRGLIAWLSSIVWFQDFYTRYVRTFETMAGVCLVMYGAKLFAKGLAPLGSMLT